MLLLLELLLKLLLHVLTILLEGGFAPTPSKHILKYTVILQQQ